MVEYIYGVALNGTNNAPTKYKVVQETPTRYIIDRPCNNFIRKVTMIDRCESYFLDEESAKAFLDSLLRSIEKMSKHFDYKNVHDMLIGIKTGEYSVEKLDEVIEYINGFL